MNNKNIIKLKKWFTLIEILIVIWVLWIMMIISNVILNIWYFKEKALKQQISNCDFIYVKNYKNIKCYLDKNKNDKLDNNEINKPINIKLRDYWVRKDFDYLKDLHLQLNTYYKIYKKNYIFKYDLNNQKLVSLTSIINI